MTRWTFPVPDVPPWQRPGQSGGRRFRTRQMTRAETDLVYAARAAGVPDLGAARVALVVALPPATRGDVDNRAKTVMDAFQFGGIYANDEQVDDLRVYRAPGLEGDAVVSLSIIRRVEASRAR